MPKKIDLVGKRFGRLIVIEECGRDKDGKIQYLCKCDCGNETVVRGYSLKRGDTTSCGCYAREDAIIRNTKYSKEERILYDVWRSMKQRCNNKNKKDYPRYGGRGIRVCEEWNDYLSFYQWGIANGYEKGKQLDRINNDGNYEPSNCRWATIIENNNNKRNTKYFTIDKMTHTLTEWCQIYNVRRSTVEDRIKRGWEIEKALTTPLTKRGGKVIGNLPTFV